jgi:hypothetical protein
MPESRTTHRRPPVEAELSACTAVDAARGEMHELRQRLQAR